MSNPVHCPECGAAIPASRPKGLCPRCALNDVLKPGVDGASEAGSDVGPPAHTGHGKDFGDYELLEEIARGGMGIVFKARQKSLDRVVAVKLLLSGPHTDAEFIKRFRVEASAAAALQHPNIVSIHEVGVHEGEHFIAMEFVDGPNLAKLVREQPLPPKRAAGYLKTIAEAIHFAHDRGILHRDLKPSNVLLDAHDQPRVTDFGLAKRVGTESQPATDVSQLTLTGQVMGSPSYMPPEQASGRRGAMSRRSDVYSLGAMLYHLLTGRPPFGGGSPAETLRQVETQEAVSLNLLNPAVPLDLETICLKCLEKEPARRYATAQELAEELGRYFNDESIRARPIGRTEKAWRWCRRKPALAAAAGTVVMLLAAVVVTSLYAARRATAARDAERRERVQAEVARTNEMVLRLTAEKAESSARREAQRAGQVAQFFQDMLQGANPLVAQGRDTALLRDLLDKTANRIEKAFSDQPDWETKIRHSFGKVYTEMGEYEKAEAMFRPALAIWRRERGEMNDNVASALHNLAMALKGRGQLDEAERLQSQSVAIYEKLHPEPHEDRAMALDHFGEILSARGKEETAEHYYRDAIAMGRQLPAASTFHFSKPLGNLAMLLDKTGRSSEAEPLHREALELRRQHYGPTNKAVAQSLHSLAESLRRQKKYAEAETHFLEALAMKRQVFGNDHLAMASTLETLGFVYMVQRRFADAEPIYRELNQSYQTRFSAGHEHSIRTAAILGRILSRRVLDEKALSDERRQQLAIEAEALHRDVFARRSRTLPAKIDLGEALVARAFSAPGQDLLKRIEFLTEGESLLLEAAAGHAARAKELLPRLYDLWETLAPGTGKAAQAAEWKQRNRRPADSNATDGKP